MVRRTRPIIHIAHDNEFLISDYMYMDTINYAMKPVQFWQ